MPWTFHIDESTYVARPPARVWAKVSDHERTPDWVRTGLRRVELLEPGASGPGTLGATRGVDFFGWPRVGERIVSYTPGERFQYAVISGMPHLSDHLGDVSAVPEGEGARVTWAIRFDFKPWHPLSWSAPLFVAGFRSVIAGGLAELKRQLEAEPPGPPEG